MEGREGEWKTKTEIKNKDNKQKTVMNMVQKTRPNYMLSTRHFKYKDAYILKVNEWKNIYHVNTNQRKAGITIEISYREDLKARSYQG